MLCKKIAVILLSAYDIVKRNYLLWPDNQFGEDFEEWLYKFLVIIKISIDGPKTLIIALKNCFYGAAH